MDDSSDYELCDICEQPAYHQCEKCKVSVCCSEQCQLQDWEDHKDICHLHSVGEGVQMTREEEEDQKIGLFGVGKSRRLDKKARKAERKARRLSRRARRRRWFRR